ncbi:MAG: hypothetical protein MPJ50_15955 [Pirellulales bacterium]|nr:hypothetical protein [Pirellulales bacterium]
MAKVGRFYGALLAKSNGDFFIVGDLKTPADYEAMGFANPGELRPLENRFVKLTVAAGNPEIPPPLFECDVEGEVLAEKLFHRLVIKRNGSVSNRLWNLIFEADENDGKDVIDANWLLAMPDEIWEIVQDQVLRCT